MKQLPDWEQYDAVPVGFKAGEEDTFTITADWMESFPDDLKIFLEDKKQNYFLNLREQPVYEFAAQPSDDPDRFTVHFGDAFGIDDPAKPSKVNIYAFEKTIVVSIGDDDFQPAPCSVYNLMGMKVACKTVVAGHNEINAGFVRGFYIVTLNAGKVPVTRKVYIR
jgi:hypothetical protein